MGGGTSDWRTTTGGEEGGATCRAGRAVVTVESAVSREVSFSGHRAAGLIRAVMVRQ